MLSDGPGPGRTSGWYIYRPSLLDRDTTRQNATVLLQIFYTKRVQLVYLGAKMLTQFPLAVLHSY